MGADSGEELTVWSYELMRQIPLHYDEDVTLKGIDLYRYSPHTHDTHAALALTVAQVPRVAEVFPAAGQVLPDHHRLRQHDPRLQRTLPTSPF